MKKGDLYTLIYKISLVYLLISFVFFTVGWMKPLYALICCIIVGFSLLKSFFETVFEDEMLVSKKEVSALFCGLLIIGIWVGISGIGGVSYQTEDHIWRNAMFETLVNTDWPIITTPSSASDPRGFSYYIGFWIPAVCVGKIFGINAGYIFQIVWAVLGIFLFYFLLCKILNKISLFPLVIFIGFSGMDILGYYILGSDMSAISQTQHLEWWSTAYQFSGFTTQLFWVFNQAIPAWLAIMMILSSKNERNIILIWSSMVLNCTMPFVGTFPIIVYTLFKNLTNVSELKNWLKNVFTFQNVIGGGCVGIISALYLSKGGSFGKIGLIDVTGGGWLLYLLFVMIEIGFLCLSIHWCHKRNLLYYMSFIWLCICPLLDIYGNKNFCMRASIPALLIVFICTIESLYKGLDEKKWKNIFVTGMILIVGSVTSLHEINRSVSMTAQSYINETTLMQTPVSFEDIMKNEYETVNANENLFFRYLCK